MCQGLRRVQVEKVDHEDDRDNSPEGKLYGISLLKFHSSFFLWLKEKW